MAERYYVKIDRENGTRTYKGPWVEARCRREATAWRANFPTYGVEVIDVPSAKLDVTRWSKAIKNEGRYQPLAVV